MFEHIIGNDQAKAYLKRTSERGTVGNSLLFAGPDGIGKSLFADAFARLLICMDDPSGSNRRKIESGNHPDIRVYRPEGKIAMHSIASMRQFSEEVYLAPAESRWRVFIIHDADRMLASSANALLKTFEEPARDAVIILLTSKPQALLPTVLSRCRPIYFRPVDEELIAGFIQTKCDKPPEEARMIAAMSQGSIAHALRLAAGEGSPLRVRLLEILSQRNIRSYKDLTDAVAGLADSVESEKKEIEAEIRATLLAGAGDGLTAVQKQAIEKEVEGAVAIHGSQEAHLLFEVIQGWYRDIHLLKAGGNPSMLIHRDYAETYKSLPSSYSLPTLDEVQKIIGSARLSVERSTSIQIVLENIFLKINLL